MDPGTLYLIATPIGNREDITLRALRVLGEVDLIAAEDTRTTRPLLQHYSIDTPLTSYHDHNERRKAPQLLAQLQQGHSIGLVSEAGTPLVSDPGYRLVRAAIDAGIRIVPLPGACAAMAALGVSGLAVHRCAFEGFLPPKAGRRRRLLGQLADEPRTLIFYESPYRVMAALEDLQEVLGDRQILLAREMTKLHEELLRGPISTVRAQLAGRTIRGEITLVVAGSDDAAVD